MLQWETACQVIKVLETLSAIDFKKMCDIYTSLFSWDHYKVS